ncbi:MAG: sulfatase, partial [Acidobacteriota bacterium]
MQVLRVSGRIRSRDKGEAGSIGPADFAVEINGRSVARKKLRSSESHESFEYVIDLKEFAGQEVKAEFFHRNHDPKGTESGWKRIVVESRRTVRRRNASEGPNVLFLRVDAVRADHCSLYGYERQTTPNLDRLGARSLVFDTAISPAAWTLPSVASMLTGKYSVKMGAVDGFGLRHKDVTLAELMVDEGLTTMAVSTNPLIGPSHAFDQGFETFILEPWERAAAVNRYFSKWLDTAESTQWFAYLHYIDPHDPYEAPPPFLGQFSDRGYRGEFVRSKALNEIANTVNYGIDPPFPVGDADLEFLRDRYDEEIRYWDSTLGQLIDDLERRNVLDRTIIVVVSDHGEEFADHGKFKHGKHLYQETINVPLLVSFPGSELVGRRTDAVETRLLMSS